MAILTLVFFLFQWISWSATIYWSKWQLHWQFHIPKRLRLELYNTITSCRERWRFGKLRHLLRIVFPIHHLSAGVQQRGPLPALRVLNCTYSVGVIGHHHIHRIPRCIPLSIPRAAIWTVPAWVVELQTPSDSHQLVQSDNSHYLRDRLWCASTETGVRLSSIFLYKFVLRVGVVLTIEALLSCTDEAVD